LLACPCLLLLLLCRGHWTTSHTVHSLRARGPRDSSPLLTVPAGGYRVGGGGASAATAVAPLCHAPSRHAQPCTCIPASHMPQQATHLRVLSSCGACALARVTDASSHPAVGVAILADRQPSHGLLPLWVGPVHVQQQPALVCAAALSLKLSSLPRPQLPHQGECQHWQLCCVLIH
jgi:hypothetical protein